MNLFHLDCGEVRVGFGKLKKLRGKDVLDGVCKSCIEGVFVSSHMKLLPYVKYLGNIKANACILWHQNKLRKFYGPSVDANKN